MLRGLSTVLITAVALLTSTACNASGIRLVSNPNVNESQGLSSSKVQSNATSVVPISTSNNTTLQDSDSTPLKSNGVPSDVLAKIQAYYASLSEHVVSVVVEDNGTGYLVIWNVGDPTLPNRYDWWSAKTGAHDKIWSSTAFTTVLEAESTDVQLLATGQNDIDAARAFPFIIENSRTNDSEPFQMTIRPYYLKVTHGVQFGDQHTCVLTSLFPTADGFQAVFGPVAGQEQAFYAGSAGCPTMSTTYTVQNHTFTIQLNHTQLSVAAINDISHLQNDFITMASAVQMGDHALIQLRLASEATYYNGEAGFLIESTRNPYVLFRFAAQSNSLYPMIEEK